MLIISFLQEVSIKGSQQKGPCRNVADHPVVIPSDARDLRQISPVGGNKDFSRGLS